MIKDYYTLSKPGIIYGNALTVIAGFLLASRGGIDFGLLCITLVGLSCVVASGCVFNNVIDRDIDAVMERTKKRPLVRGVITIEYALLYGVIVGVFGFSILIYGTNIFAVGASLIGFLVYVFGYSLWLKRTSTHGTIIGSISGAMPILVGYVTVRGEVDVVAVILFFILALWQMTHSFAIALYRLDDYKRAHIDVLPVKKGVHRTKIQMLIYTGLFGIATLLLFVTGETGWIYFFVMGLVSFSWILYSIKGFYIPISEDKQWSKTMFLFSIEIGRAHV